MIKPLWTGFGAVVLKSSVSRKSGGCAGSVISCPRLQSLPGEVQKRSGTPCFAKLLVAPATMDGGDAGWASGTGEILCALGAACKDSAATPDRSAGGGLGLCEGV